MDFEDVTEIPGALGVDPTKPRLAASGTDEVLSFVSNDYWDMHSDSMGFEIVPSRKPFMGVGGFLIGLSVFVVVAYFWGRHYFPLDAQPVLNVFIPILSLMFVIGGVLAFFLMRKELNKGPLITYSGGRKTFELPRLQSIIPQRQVLRLDLISGGKKYRWSDGQVRRGNGQATQLHLVIALSVDRIVSLPVIASSGSARFARRITRVSESIATITGLPLQRIQEVL